MDSFIRDIPKAELHLHIEGTLEPELMLELSERNDVSLPYGSVEEIRNAYRFTDLQSFLDVYYAGMRVLVEEQDFYDLTRAYLERACEENVRHAEIFLDPQAHTGRDVDFDAAIQGILDALDDGRSRLGVSSRLIACFLRDRTSGEAMETLERVLRFRDRIVAVGLDSAEAGNPPAKFRAVFDRARSEGLRTVAHAGEEGPPEYIAQALDLLGVSRIDHGVRCLEDPELVDRLRRERVPLTVCPLSNVALGVYDDMEHQVLPELLDAGLLVTVNSDDPAYFGGYVTENFLAVHRARGLEREEVVGLCRNAFEASFLEAEERTDRLRELDDFVREAEEDDGRS